MNYRFPKAEKLKSRKSIEYLFSDGKSITQFPIKMFFISVENNEITQAGFAVPKRNFKKAVDRNRIKRQVREAYRLQKHLLNTNNKSKFALLFLYLGKEKTPYIQLEKAMIGLLKKI
jgi:ribonuclease P protein component